ncbi:unnamed protein product, partial [Phaeothamnion confervicola]
MLREDVALKRVMLKDRPARAVGGVEAAEADAAALAGRRLSCVSPFADDTSLALGHGDLDRAVGHLELFAEASGLRVNVDKSALWLFGDDSNGTFRRAVQWRWQWRQW